MTYFSTFSLAGLSRYKLQNSTLPISSNPNKIKQNPKFHLPNPISYPISLNPTKIKHFTHFTTQKLNSHLIKNPLTISKTSLFISTFTDNTFYQNLIYSPLHIGVLKNYTQNHQDSNHTVLFLYKK